MEYDIEWRIERRGERKKRVSPETKIVFGVSFIHFKIMKEQWLTTKNDYRSFIHFLPSLCSDKRTPSLQNVHFAWIMMIIMSREDDRERKEARMTIRITITWRLNTHWHKARVRAAGKFIYLVTRVTNDFFPNRQEELWERDRENGKGGTTEVQWKWSRNNLFDSILLLIGYYWTHYIILKDWCK